MRTKIARMLTALAVAMGILLTGSPARADGEELRRDIFLASRAGDYGGYTTIIPNDRRIWLAAGNYHWTHEWTELYPWGTARTAYNLRLGQGWHYWNCHVFPHPTNFWRYQTRCYLRPEGKANIYSPMLEIQPHGWAEWNGYLGSDYIWESTLTLL